MTPAPKNPTARQETCPGNLQQHKPMTTSEEIILTAEPSARPAASYFDGGLLSYIGYCILGSIITTVTLGICFPWAICMLYEWRINHTVIEGRRLQFNGTALGLFGHWIKWLLLCIITLGIYGFWVWIALEKWKTKHTTFAN